MQPSSKGHRSSGAADAVSQFDALVRRFPLLVTKITAMLDGSISGLSKKAGMVLWIIDCANSADNYGPFLETSTLVAKFRQWSQVSLTTGSSAVSVAKRELFEKELIYSAISPRRVYLTGSSGFLVGSRPI